MFNLYRPDIKKSWTELSLLLGRRKPRIPIKDLVVEGITITENIQMAKETNEYFASVETTLDSEFHPANEHENIPLLQRFEKYFFFIYSRLVYRNVSKLLLIWKILK